MTIGSLMVAAGMLWLTQIGVDTAYVTHVLPSEIIMSVGMGFVFVPLSSTALIGVGNHDAGVASALVNTTQQIGGSLGTALLNTIATVGDGGVHRGQRCRPTCSKGWCTATPGRSS